ncbi:unnamed protein product [Amaranthus hypochondriacus]
MATHSQMDPTQNPSSIHFLHPSDHAGIKLVSTPFDGTGYGDWKRSMMIGLIAKNKVCFVDGIAIKLASNTIDAKCWERCNSMVIGWLIVSLDRIIAKSVMYYNDAYEIWSDLEERFGKSSSAQLYSLQEELSNLNQTGSMSVADYFTRSKSLWDEIDHLDPLPVCTCNGYSCTLTKKILKNQQDQRLIHFLMRLDDQFDQARTNILMMKELPTAQGAYRILVQEERHKNISKTAAVSTESMAFVADKRKFYDHNQNRNSDPNLAYKRPKTGGIKKNNYYCDHCKMRGHSIQRCFKIHGYPDPKGKKIAANVHNESKDYNTDIGGTGLTSEQLTNLMAFINKSDAPTDAKDADLANDSSVFTATNLAGPFQERDLTSW